MCTLTFVPNTHGFLVGMNRDELLAREPARRPKMFVVGSSLAAYPYEASGGTWIGVNEHAITLALLNWYDSPAGSLYSKPQSRGTVIPQLLGQETVAEIHEKLSALPLAGILPFRLVGFALAERSVAEWRWDGSALQHLSHPWATRHWFSSSLSDVQAERIRGFTCEDARSVPMAGSALWLRALHASHSPQPGPFSICMHRLTAASVSYTEVACDSGSIGLSYRAGQPCDETASIEHLVFPHSRQPIPMFA